MKNSEYIEQALKLKFDNNIANLIDRESKVLKFKKGQTIVFEDEMVTSVYFIIEGIVRGYYIDEKGEDVTKCFSQSNEFCGTEVLRTKSKSSFTIECLENSYFIKLQYDLIERIMKLDENLKDTINNLFLNEVTKLENRAKNLMLLNAEQRYLDFCRKYPELSMKVDLRYIASYIGVRPASLSRIRKKLKSSI